VGAAHADAFDLDNSATGKPGASIAVESPTPPTARLLTAFRQGQERAPDWRRKPPAGAQPRPPVERHQPPGETVGGRRDAAARYTCEISWHGPERPWVAAGMLPPAGSPDLCLINRTKVHTNLEKGVELPNT
jgi:hypothetical protein